MTNKFNVGDTVYIYEHWSSGIIRATVVECVENGYEIKCKEFVDKQGNGVGSSYGNMTVAANNIWATVDEAFNEIERRKLDSVTKYCEEIKTINDLIAFPIHHCLNGEEYTNYEALKAYKIRAKELLNIDIE